MRMRSSTTRLVGGGAAVSANMEGEEDDLSLEWLYSSEQNEEVRGGYDCEFVERPPEDIQTDCPICLLILREPCLISCECGHKICRQCVEQVKKEDRPCPICNKTNFTFLRDYGLERYLKRREVWCSMKKKGCEWKGSLKEYEKHLNENPTMEEQLIGCQLVKVQCIHGCGESVIRCNLTNHQEDECPKRLYSCEYCDDYVSSYDHVVNNHYSDCSFFPVSCPNECCSDTFLRQDIVEHVEDDCPLTEVPCPLHYAGCAVKLPRKELAEHMKDTAKHLTVLATVTQRLLIENQELKHNFQDLSKENQELCNKVEALQQTKNGFPIDFRVKYPNEESVYLPSFYTHCSHGYRMCMRVDPNGNGVGKGTHISIFSFLMIGRYDNHLKWPFRGDITIQIVNQLGDHNHVEKTTNFNENTPDNAAGRVTVTEYRKDAYRVNESEKKGKGRGNQNFLAHNALNFNAAKNTQYLKDGVIIVRVARVTVT